MAGKKTIDPLFAAYARTAPLMDLRFTLKVIAERRARGICYDGPRTAAIVAGLEALEAELSAVLERGEKSKTAPASSAAQKRIVWQAIDRYRSSLAYGHLTYIDGRPEFCLEPYRPSAELLAVLSDPYDGPRIVETFAGYRARLESNRPLTERNDRAVSELCAIGTEPQYSAGHRETFFQWLERTTAPEPERSPMPEQLSGAAADLLFWDAVRMIRARKAPENTAIDWSAERLEAERLEAERRAEPKPEPKPARKRRGASSASASSASSAA